MTRFWRVAIDNAPQLKRAFDLVWESAPGWTLASAVLVVIQGILPLAALYLMKLIVDAVTTGVEAPDSDAFGKVLILIALAGGVALLIVMGRSASTVISEAQSALVSDRVQELLHSKSVEVDLEYYENTDYYETLHRAQKEASFRPTRIVNGLLKVGQSNISLVAVVGLLISLSWIIAAVLIIAALPAGFVRLKYADKFYKWQISCTAKERVAWYHHQLLTDNNHAKEIRIFGLGPLFMRRYRNLREQLRKERLALTTRRSAADLASQSISVVAVFGSFAYIAYQTLQGNITLGDLVMYFGAFQQGQNFLNTFLTSMASLYEDRLFLTYLHEFLELEPKVKEPLNPRSIPQSMREGICFDRVGFGYPNTETKVIEEVTFRIRPGQVVALVALLVVVGVQGASDNNSIKIIQASEILANITRGEPVEYWNVTVEGDLDLSKLDLPTKHVERSALGSSFLVLSKEVQLVNSSIRIGNSQIHGDVYFGNTIIQEASGFEGTNFSGFVSFRGTIFSGYANFRGTKFSGLADFKGAQFFDRADFGRVFVGDGETVLFNDLADFSFAKFSGDADFYNAQFNRGGDFSHANFNGYATFQGILFNGAADFRGAQFNWMADFGSDEQTFGRRGVLFNGPADFGGAKFNHFAEFYEAQFSDTVSFRKAVFNCPVDFWYAHFDQTASLTDAHFEKTLGLSNTIFSTMRLEGISFGNNSLVSLKESEFIRLYVSWNSIKNQLDYDGAVYQALINNFKNLEQFEDADDCYYQYRKLSQAKKDFGWSKFIDVLAWQSCGYGVRPSYTLAWSFKLIFLFGVIFWAGKGIQISPTPYQEIYAPGYKKKRQFRKDISNLWSKIRRSSRWKGWILSSIPMLYFTMASR